jgi:hypothetical protein
MDHRGMASLLRRTQWSFAASMVSLLIVILLIASGLTVAPWIRTIGNILVYVFLIAGIAFLVFLGMLVHRLERSAARWLFLVIVFFPIGAVIAIVRVRKIVQAKLQGSTQLSSSTVNGS